MSDTKHHVSRIAVVAVTALLVVSGLAGTAVAGAEAHATGAAGTDAEATQEQATDCDFNRVFDEAIPSVVTVRVFGQSGERGTGSGWVYARNDTSALVVTNYHVVEGSVGADARFADGQWRNAEELVGGDPVADLAVLRIANVSDDVRPLRVARSLPDEGDEVAALGSPLGLEATMSTGIVSAVDRSVTVGANGGVYTVVDAIQVDAPISPGNSGGPLVDCDGRVVGVNFAGVSPLAGQNINFAISATMVERIVPEILENGSYNHSYVGIRGVSLSPTIARINGIDGTTQGVLVDSVIAGGPAEDILQGSPSTEGVTGIPVGGDVVVAVDGTAVGDVPALRDYLFEETRPGDTVTVTVLRNGERTEVELTLGERPFAREGAATGQPSV